MNLEGFEPRFFTATATDDVVLVKFGVSHINDEENIDELGHELFALVEQCGFRKVVLNMSSVEYFTSSVVGKLITLHRKLHRSDGLLCLCALTNGVHDVLSASRLLTYFVFSDTEAAAIEKMKSHVSAPAPGTAPVN